MHARTTILAILIVAPITISACTAMTWYYTSDGRSVDLGCKAYCTTFADDGAACVEWSEDASAACIGDYVAPRELAGECCYGGGGYCPIFTPIPVGTQCMCVIATEYGPYYQPGRACNAIGGY